MHSECGRIDPAELAANDLVFRAPYDPATPIQQLLSRIDKCIRLAEAANAEYTDEHVVVTAFNIMFQTGLYASACRKWHDEDEEDKTWGDFKTYFLKAHQTLRLSQATTQSAGYHAANYVATDRDIATMDAIAYLAKSQTSDQSTISTMASSQTQLQHALQEELAKMATQHADIQALQSTVKQLASKNGGAAKRRPANKPRPSPTTRFYHNTNYCHTHGYHVHDNHTSATCQYPLDGHHKDATRSNTKGGSIIGKELVGACQGRCLVPQASLITDNKLNQTLTTTTPNLTLVLKETLGIADTGATGHFLTSSSHCLDKTPVTNGVVVHIPNGDTMKASHTALLDLPTLPVAATTAHVFQELTTPLISVGQLCDNGCTATFTATNATIQHSNNTILEGQRDDDSGLWTLVTHKKRPNHAALNVHCLNSKSELATFFHQCCFSPVPATWIKAIQAGYFAAWPGFTVDLINKHLPKSMATAKGHLRQQYQHTQSTKPGTNTSNTEQVAATARTHETYYDVFQPTGQVYTDQTGRFPAISARGNQYVMVLYDYDSNAILTEPMSSCHEHELVRAYTKLHTLLTARGLKPLLQKLDNEAPKGLKKFMTAQNVDFQLVPPHVHRRNAAERAIGTFKEYFIAGLSSTNKLFPMHLWCQLLPQATITLNLMRKSRLYPLLSAHNQLHGVLNYDRTPLAPPGTKVLIHEKPQVRGSWAPHGAEGWYVGPALEHYRCYTTFVTSTARNRIADTVEFFPTHTHMPLTSSKDRAIVAAQELTDALLHPAPSAPHLAVGDRHRTALTQLATITNVVQPPAATTPIAPAPAPANPSRATIC